MKYGIAHSIRYSYHKKIKILRLYDGILNIMSELPEGKGLSSSSADLVAAARAVFRYFGQECPNVLLEKFLMDIEPSDGVMYEGVVSYYHREARLKENLGHLPPMLV